MKNKIIEDLLTPWTWAHFWTILFNCPCWTHPSGRSLHY